jgi:hypothetical protein
VAVRGQKPSYSVGFSPRTTTAAMTGGETHTPRPSQRVKFAGAEKTPAEIAGKTVRERLAPLAA